MRSRINECLRFIAPLFDKKEEEKRLWPCYENAWS
jgi:hypothetical protein